MQLPESAKSNYTFSDQEADHHKHFDRELKEMVNTLTHRVSNKPSASQHHQEGDHDDEGGIRIVTLTGTNSGATMRTELDDKLNKKTHDGLSIGEPDSEDMMSTYVNSNYQAVNNSIMMRSSYDTNDPGVHLDISDFFEPLREKKEKKDKKKDKKDKKKEKSSYDTDDDKELDDQSNLDRKSD